MFTPEIQASQLINNLFGEVGFQAARNRSLQEILLAYAVVINQALLYFGKGRGYIHIKCDRTPACEQDCILGRSLEDVCDFSGAVVHSRAELRLRKDTTHNREHLWPQ